MPQLERSRARARRITGWGGGDPTDVMLLRAGGVDPLREELGRLGDGGAGAIARGMGRSYGDAAQLEGGLVLEMTGLRGYELDAERGLLTAQAGVTLAELLPALVPRGWILPVLPGTQHVTIGGMISSDVHGKNHGAASSFGTHVTGLGLLTSAGDEVELTPGQPDGWFEATVGGMGLTGVILWARIALAPVAGGLMSVDTDRAEDLDTILTLLREPGGRHRVAWLDLLAGPGRIRGVVTRAEYAEAAVHAHADHGPDVATRATVPSWWPGGLPTTGVRAFNELRFRTSPRRQRGHLEPIGLHMFPLDRLSAWPRLYGPRGLVQYQIVVPPGQEPLLERVVAVLREHGVPSYLVVLKDFGDGSGAPLSFPIRGWTLALDLPRSADGLGRALDRCDELVAAAGGRVYLSKDSRMGPELLGAMYPRLDEWREVRAQMDPAQRWRSDLGVRVGLVAGPVVAAGREGAPARGVVAAGRGGASASPPAPSPRRVLLIGGSSEIGLAIVRRLAADGPVLPFLLGRDPQRMGAALADLARDGTPGGELAVLDGLDFAAHDRALADAFEAIGGFDVIVLAIGVLGGQAGLDADLEESREVLEVGVLACGLLLIAALRALRVQGHGSLIALSSVAAERPRSGNAVYGAAKAGFDSLAQGLADSLAGSGIEVLVVRPGFVRTKMTEGLPDAPLATTPEKVAELTVAALGHGSATVWAPRALRWVFAVLRHLPRGVYRRLPL